MDQWLAMLRKALEKNYDWVDGVLAAMQSNKKRKRDTLGCRSSVARLVLGSWQHSRIPFPLN
jgi:hypothetical protein